MLGVCRGKSTIKVYSNGFRKKLSSQIFLIANTRKQRHETNTNKIVSLINKNTINRPIDAWFVTGFTDAEGSFIVKLSKAKNKRGWSVQLQFTIGLHTKDTVLLQLIRLFLGDAGTVRKDRLRDVYYFSVTSLKHILTKIIPHFDAYPLITQKQAHFLLFKQVAYKINKGEHLTKTGLNEIINLRASINRGLTPGLKKCFPLSTPVIRPSVENQIIINPFWVAGFTSGDGCFLVDISLRANSQKNYRVTTGFTLTQDSRDKILMESLIAYFNCGTIFSDKRGCTYYRVSKLSDITDKIIPFFLKYNILGVKAKDFIDWCKAAELIKEKKHLTPEGLAEIKLIKQGINTGRPFVE